MAPSPTRTRLLPMGVAALVLLAAPPGRTAPPEVPGAQHAGSGPRNRLAAEASPYLQLHASNPVDWYPWGEEAFRRARAEDKPIFLSVGYSTCYWCHVMEREVFADPEIAALMNRWFVSVKVDREERPDVDEVYMAATQRLTGSGGWPNSVFLTPEGKPFFAGTYFPPEDRRGRPGFPRVLRSLAQSWEQEREQVEAAAERTAAALAAQTPRVLQSVDVPEPDELLRRAVQGLRGRYDPEHGGFSPRTKFPTPARLELLLAAHARGVEGEPLAMLTHTLDEMALGGIFDHVAGGFHRYTTEPTWSVPHFEKMLYDNAQLAALYARAYRATRRALYRTVVERTVAYLEREMRLPGGGLASAQDAEVAGEEGASYVWTRVEVEAALGAERAEPFLSVYELRPLHGEESVLRVRLPLAPALARFEASDPAALLARFEAERARLLEVRARRPQPLRDDKVIAAWNGLAIRGLVEAARALERPAWLGRAEQAARFVLERLGEPDGGLRRSYIAGQAREAGVLDDYAFLADGLLALHEATGDSSWRREARRLADVMLARLEDREHGGFFLSEARSGLFTRPKSYEDGALPSGNGVALGVLRRLGADPGGARYGEAASGLLAGFSPWMGRAPFAIASAVVELARRPEARVPPVLAAARPAGATRSRLPRSEDHVRVRVEADPSTPGGVVTRMTVDPGWHVNANPASLAYLLPTTVALEVGGELRDVRYPPGESFQPEFVPQPLAVYAGSVGIPARLPDGLEGPVTLVVRYQACNERVCLPPGTSRAELRLGR